MVVGGIATGFTRGLGGLVGCRAALGVAEAAGIPAAGKAIHQYLRPAERALGNAVNQAGVSLGLIVAPPLATWLAVRGGWRQAFVATGILGLAWIPVWNWAARRAPPLPLPKLEPGAAIEMLRDRAPVGFRGGQCLSMIGYSLWTNWTTLVPGGRAPSHARRRRPGTRGFRPLFATLGRVRRRMAFAAAGGPRDGGRPARCRVCLAAAVLSLVTAAIPPAPTRRWASAGISLSIFAVAAFSVNMYTLPLDIFGGARAAFAVSMLVASYGAVQVVVSPLFGKAIDLYGYAPVTAIAALTPLAACAVSVGNGVGADETAAQAVDFPPAGQRSRSRGGDLCTGDAGVVPAHGRRGSQPGARPAPFRGHGRELAGAAAASLRKFRIGLAPVMLSARAQRAAPRRVSPGAPQDPGLQSAAGAPSSAL